MGNCIGPSGSAAQCSDGGGVARARQYREAVAEGFSEAYRVVRRLGEGTQGEALLVVDVETHTQKAIKVVKLPLPQKFLRALSQEIRHQSALGQGHVNIIATEEVLVTPHCLGLVMEYAAGGTLDGFLNRKYYEQRLRKMADAQFEPSQLAAARQWGAQNARHAYAWSVAPEPGAFADEGDVRYLFRQACNAVDYCHRHKIVHRDLKLDNILLTNHNPPRVKLCDFGFARGWVGDELCTTVVGTPEYMAPQITAAPAHGGKAEYDGAKADVWALGGMLCVLLTGVFPYGEATASTATVTDPLRRMWLKQHTKRWNGVEMEEALKQVSVEAKDLLAKMLELVEENRLDVAAVKRHPWMLQPLRPELERALATLDAEQAAIDLRLRSMQEGGSHDNHADRERAIGDLLKLASSQEYKKQPTESSASTSFVRICSRVSLRTTQDTGPAYNSRSLPQPETAPAAGGGQGQGAHAAVGRSSTR